MEVADSTGLGNIDSASCPELTDRPDATVGMHTCIQLYPTEASFFSCAPFGCPNQVEVLCVRKGDDVQRHLVLTL